MTSCAVQGTPRHARRAQVLWTGIIATVLLIMIVVLSHRRIRHAHPRDVQRHACVRCCGAGAGRATVSKYFTFHITCLCCFMRFW